MPPDNPHLTEPVAVRSDGGVPFKISPSLILLVTPEPAKRRLVDPERLELAMNPATEVGAVSSGQPVVPTKGRNVVGVNRRGESPVGTNAFVIAQPHRAEDCPRLEVVDVGTKMLQRLVNILERVTRKKYVDIEDIDGRVRESGLDLILEQDRPDFVENREGSVGIKSIRLAVTSVGNGLHEHPVAAAQIEQDISGPDAAAAFNFGDRNEALLSYPTITKYVFPSQTTNVKLRHESGVVTGGGDSALMVTEVRGGHISWWCF